MEEEKVRDVRNLMIQNRLTYIKHFEEFQDIFGVPLSQFWDKLLGFDVVKFDVNFIKPEEGKSTRQVVREKYGIRAEQLCTDLIKLDH